MASLSSQRWYDSKEGILKAMQSSWGKFFSVVEARRDAVARGESLSWFFAFGQFELRKEGMCLFWNPNLVSVKEDLVGEEDDSQCEVIRKSLSSSRDGRVIIPPPILRCSACGHIFRRDDREKIDRSRHFVSLENFSRVPLRRAIARMKNPTTHVYGIPIQTQLQNGLKLVPTTVFVDLFDERCLDRIVCGGDFIEVVFFKFFHEGCRLLQGERLGESIRPISSNVQPDRKEEKRPKPTVNRKSVREPHSEKKDAVTGTGQRESVRKRDGKSQVPRKPKSEKARVPLRHREVRADENPGNWYSKKIGALCILDGEEEQRLAARVQNGDMIAREEFIRANLRLAYWVAYRFWRRCPHRSNIDPQDFVQEANIALLNAVSHFKTDQGARFSSYAVPVIRRHLSMVYTELSGVVYVPPYMHWKCVEFSRNLEIFLTAFDRGEAIAQAAAKSGISLKVARDFAELYLSGLVVPIDAEIGGDGKRTFQDIIPDRSPSPEEVCASSDRDSIVRDILAEIPKRHRNVLFGQYGLFETQEEKTLHKLGEEAGVSRQRAQQMRKQGEEIVRRRMKHQRYSPRDFLDD